MPSLVSSLQDEDIQKSDENLFTNPITELNDEEFNNFIDLFNQKKTEYNPETFNDEDMDRLTNDRMWASCFVKQHKRNFKSASEAAAKTMKWRAENKVAEINENTFKEERENCAVFVDGRAADGTRVLYMIVKKFVKGKSTDVQNQILYWMETLHRNEMGHEVTIVMHLDGAKISNLELSTIRFIKTCFDTYFPAIFKKIILVDLPWLCNTVWQMVKGWLSDDQRKRVNFTSRKQLGRLIPRPHKLNCLDGEISTTCSEH